MMSRALTRSAIRGSILSAAFLLPALLLAGCGGVEGRYSHREKMPDGSFMEMALELKGSDVAVMTMGPAGDASMSTEGTYKVDGNKVTVTVAGDAQVFTLDGDKLTSKGFGETIELVKE